MNYELEVAQEIIRGNTWEGIAFTLTKNDTDYTGATIRCEFRDTVEGQLFLTKQIVPSSAINGQIIFTLALTAADSKLLLADTVYTDIEITTSLDKKTPIKVTFTVIGPITSPV